MATITKPNTFSAGAVIVASEHNDCFDTIYNDYNGNITNANVSASAAIVDTKLATIATASKVNLTALGTASQAGGDVISYNGSAWVRVAASTSRYRVLMSMGSTSAASFQQINLASASAITGALPLANGGSGGTGNNIIKGWAKFDGTGTPAYDGSYNTAGSITDNGTGDYTISWDTNFANSSHAIVFGSGEITAADWRGRVHMKTQAADTLTIKTVNDSNTPTDIKDIYVMAVGAQ